MPNLRKHCVVQSANRAATTLQSTKKQDRLNDRLPILPRSRNVKTVPVTKSERQSTRQELHVYTSYFYPSTEIQTMTNQEHKQHIDAIQGHHASYTAAELQQRSQSKLTRTQAVTTGPKEQVSRVPKVEMSGCKISMATDAALKLIAKELAPTGLETANKETTIEHMARVTIHQMVEGGYLDQLDSPFHDEDQRENLIGKLAKLQSMVVEAKRDSVAHWNNAIETLLDEAIGRA